MSVVETLNVTGNINEKIELSGDIAGKGQSISGDAFINDLNINGDMYIKQFIDGYLNMNGMEISGDLVVTDLSISGDVGPITFVVSPGLRYVKYRIVE